jgi:hypothetical protein
MIRTRFGVLVGRLLISLCLAVLCSSCGPGRTENPSVSDAKRYTLLTWNSAEAKVCFVLVNRSQRDNLLRRWNPKSSGKCGIAELKGALKSLPKGTEVLWEELPRSGFNYPSADIMDEVKKSTESEGIDVVYAPILD